MKIKKSHVNINVSFLILILSLTVAGTLNQSVKPQNTVETPKSSDGEITIITPENKTYTEPDNGYYPATYEFENEIDGTTGTAIDFVDIDDSDSGCSASIVSLSGEHHKVIKLEDTSGAGNADVYNLFGSTIAYGSIEFYIYDSDASDGFYVQIWDSSRAVAGLRIYGDGFHIYTVPDWTVISGAPTPQDNMWYHIRIDLECTSGSYQGLSQWDYYVWINGIRYGPYDFGQDYQPDRIRLTSNDGHSNYYGYVDAIGYSWDPGYSIGDNLNEGIFLSYQNSTNLDWKGYSLDGGNNKTIVGNTTIPMPLDGVHYITMFGNDTMGTMYESNLRYFTMDTSPYIGITTPENKTYTEADSGYYPGSYGFENDEDGNIPEGWVDLSSSGCIVEVESYLDGHNNVLKLEDPSTTYSSGTENVFSNQTNGTIELWFQKTIGQSTCYIVLHEDVTQAVKMAIDSNNNGLFGLNVGGVFEYVTAGYSDDDWFHIRIDFDCASGKTDVYINNVLQFENKDFFNAAPSVSQLRFSTNSHYAGTWYADAISYSWDPNYNIGDNVNEGLLLSYDSNIEMNWTSYSLDGQMNRTIIGNSTIPMPSDGTHSIQVFGNDSLGTMYESNLRYFTTNALGPDISITSPISNQLYGTTPPDFSLSILDSDLDARWYSLDGGTTNLPFSGLSGTISQTEWDKMGNGTVTITFYANDTANNVGQAGVTVRKDIIAPVITIISPTTAEEFDYTPIFDITIAEASSNEFWYTIDNGANNYTISSLTGTINQTAWDTAPDGPVTIRFYARDDVGNIGTNSVIVAKIPSELPTIPPGIPGYDFYLLIGALSAISALLIRKRMKS